MRGHGRPINSFRRRLWQLIEAQFEGKYTLLATRARIPISSMQHYVHAAKRLPGGEQLLRIAEACGVSVQYLVSGEEVIGATERRRHAPIGHQQDETLMPTHRAFPVFRCACPDACPLTADVPPVALAVSHVVLEGEMVAGHDRLLAVEVTTDMPCPGWPTGARVVVNWDAREPRWEAVTLIHVDGRCQLGHAVHREGGLLFAGPRDNGPRVLAGEGRILGTVICVVAPL